MLGKIFYLLNFLARLGDPFIPAWYFVMIFPSLNHLYLNASINAGELRRAYVEKVTAIVYLALLIFEAFC